MAGRLPYREVPLPDVTGETRTESAQWIIRGERLIDKTPRLRVSLADVELPDGRQFTQYVFRMRRQVTAAVLDEPGAHILMLRRHRFIINRWVWELPGGYMKDGEPGGNAAGRHTAEETGWRPRDVRFLLSFQPMVGNADFPQDIYLGRGADQVGDPGGDEVTEVRFVPLDDAAAMIASGDIAGAASVVGVQHALLLRAGVELPAR
jgi:8-oxo-dGTP pyrophosphatase MutT (NUDIX family)